MKALLAVRADQVRVEAGLLLDLRGDDDRADGVAQSAGLLNGVHQVFGDGRGVQLALAVALEDLERLVRVVLAGLVPAAMVEEQVQRDERGQQDPEPAVDDHDDDHDGQSEHRGQQAAAAGAGADEGLERGRGAALSASALSRT